jgi:tetratricopeptide (TPR) repeat protein
LKRFILIATACLFGVTSVHAARTAPLTSTGQYVQKAARKAPVNPFDPVALNNLAVAKADAYQYQEALKLLERAVRLAPDRNDIAANLDQLKTWVNTYGIPTGEIRQQLMNAEFSTPGRDIPPPPPALWQERN